MDNDIPTLGTSEAAVRSCVSMISAVTGQREDVMAYWLDLYFFVRRAYEREQRQEEPAARTLIRIEDLYPLLRDMLQRELRSALDGKAVVPLAGIPAGDTSSGAAAPPSPRGEGRGEPAGEKPQKVSSWTKRKSRILDKLLEARKQGATYAAIVQASDGAVSEADLFAALNAKKLPAAAWTDLESALDRILAETIVAQEEG